MFDHLLGTLAEEVAALGLPARPSVLDVGCGEGSVLRALARGSGGHEIPGTSGGDQEIAAHGVDISTPAIDLAARSFPGATWIVANADRTLPWADGSFDLVLSITARRNPPEFRRVLAPGGRVILAVPGKDDLIELREAVQGRGVRRERLAAALDEIGERFEPERRRTVRHAVRLDAPHLQDLLASTYRGARESERRRAEALGSLDVTLSFDVAVLRAGPGDP